MNTIAPILSYRIKRFREFLEASRDKRIVALYGGAGSGKSVSVAQYICWKFTTEKDLTILVSRRHLPSLKITAMKLIRDILKQWKVEYLENRSEGTITYGTNQILFKPLDDPEKIKSFDASIIWVEEATDIDWDTYLQLDLRARKPGVKNQIYYTFNPIDVRHWTVTEIIEGKDKENVAVMHSTWQDNQFLPDDYVRRLQELKDKDENYYRIYTLGLPGMVENLIYSRYEIQYFNIDREPDFYGLDLGYNDPNALVAGWIDDQKIYLRELIFETEQDPNDLVDAMKKLGIAQGPPIYCDHRTDIIELLSRNGYNVQKADKAVHEGILHVKSHKLVIHEESVNLLKEIQRYKWMKDKNNKILDSPVKFNDHLMDAMRYGIYSHRNSGNLEQQTIRDIIGGTRLPDMFTGGF